MARRSTRTATTVAQGERIAELAAASGERIHPERVQGRSVVAAMTRYCRSRDSAQINPALYDFLTGHLSFIAHFSLKPPDGGFQTHYADPDLLCQDLLAAFSPRRVSSVFTDGMTDKEVEEELRAIARRHLGS